MSLHAVNGSGTLHKRPAMENSQRCPLLDVEGLFDGQPLEEFDCDVTGECAKCSVDLLLVLLTRFDVMEIFPDECD